MGSALTQETGNDLTSFLFPVVVNWASCTSCHQNWQYSGHWPEVLSVPSPPQQLLFQVVEDGGGGRLELCLWEIT